MGLSEQDFLRFRDRVPTELHFPVPPFIEIRDYATKQGPLRVFYNGITRETDVHSHYLHYIYA